MADHPRKSTNVSIKPAGKGQSGPISVHAGHLDPSTIRATKASKRGM